MLIHRAVATTFIPNPNNYPCVNHINLIRDDNRADNLEWCTHKQNMRHAYDNDRMWTVPGKGDKCPASKLTEKDVAVIKNRLKRGEGCLIISKDYIVGESAIREIKAGRSWGHVK